MSLNNGKTKIDVAVLKTEVSNIKTDLNDLATSFHEFKDNHFEHFRAWVYGLLIGNLTAIVVLLLSVLFKKQ